jgi:1-deoxy-D-xylulose-5-phosphate reductoisomerase
VNQKKKNIAILGSTGSIGKQALEVIAQHPDRFNVEVLTANNNVSLLIDQAIRFKPNVVVIANEKHYEKAAGALQPEGIKVYTGLDSIASVVQMDSIDLVLTAMVGFAGLKPTIKAIEAGKTIALSNKESLVVAGEYITTLARNRGVDIYPVDSEHSAIFQCITGEFHNRISKIILTASGGPFLGKNRQDLVNVTKESALKHPRWNMGAKVTIDSATLMNKGLEVIEARWLFDIDKERIEVVIHPQSIIHSMVEFEDGSVKAQLSLPDMRLPIQYALSYPDRIKSEIPRISFDHRTTLTFDKPDTSTFRSLDLAYHALEKNGNMPCILNAANEIAVEAFLSDRLRFLEISDIIETCMGKISYIHSPGYEDFTNTDLETRIKANELIA